MRPATWLSRILAPSSRSARRPTRGQFCLSFEHLECRRVLATLLVSPTGLFDTTPTQFTSIQSAVDASAPGDTILVGPGTYQEQLLITKDGLDLTSSSPGAAVIQGPQNGQLFGHEAIVDIQGAANVVLDGFTIMGPGPNLALGLTFGVYVDGSSSATIENNHVTRICDDPSSGNLSGFGIEVGLSPTSAGALGLPSTTGSALVLNNTVDYYQANGIVVDNAGSSAIVQGNTVTGLASDALVQNGIVVSNDAVGVVQGNTVTSNLLGLDRNTESAGILLSNPGSGVEVLNNTVVFNDAGIVVQGAVNPVISGNTISGSTFDGIQLTGTTGALITSNVASGNGLNGIYAYFDADNNVIADNTAASNGQDGIEVMQSTGNLLQGNTVFGNARYGISQFLRDGESNTLTDDNAVFGDGIADLFVDG
jgi:parallel beta-helix repeat protein